MVILMIAFVAHCPAPGVKVNWLTDGVNVLIAGGSQLPLIPFKEVEGNVVATLPSQRTLFTEKVGVTC